jgi:hypothetical protein
MSSDTIAGGGDFVITTLNNSPNIIFTPQPISLELSTETSKIVARAMKNGRVVDVASALGSESTTATLTYEQVNKDHLSYFLNMKWEQSSSIPWPVTKTAKIPDTAPYEIADADITTENEAGVLVYLESDANNANEKSLIPATEAPDSGEAQADGTSGKLIFNVAEAGGTITYKVPKTWTSGRTLGWEPTIRTFGAVEFIGVVYLASDQEIGVRIHQMTPDNKPTFGLSDGVPNIVQEFTCGVPSGRPAAMSFFDLDSLQA